MSTGSEIVRLSEKTGSDGWAVRTTRLTQLRHAAANIVIVRAVDGAQALPRSRCKPNSATLSVIFGRDPSKQAKDKRLAHMIALEQPRVA